LRVLGAFLGPTGNEEETSQGEFVHSRLLHLGELLLHHHLLGIKLPQSGQGSSRQLRHIIVVISH